MGAARTLPPRALLSPTRADPTRARTRTMTRLVPQTIIKYYYLPSRQQSQRRIRR
jgi:hypothetical protein